jgi:hypothetical protein
MFLLHKQTILTRRSTVLRLPFLLGFPGAGIVVRPDPRFTKVVLNKVGHLLVCK